MKIKKIAAICTKSKWVEIHDVTDDSGAVTQWMGNREGMYRIDGVPYMAESAVLTFFDIDTNKRAEYGVKQEEVENMYGLYDDVSENERVLIPLGFSFDFMGGKLVVFQNTCGKTYLINAKYLTPLSDTAELWEREIGNAVNIVAKEGFLTCAVITPYDPPKDLLVKLETVTEGVKRQVQMNERNEMAGEREHYQKTLYEESQEPVHFDEESEEE